MAIVTPESAHRHLHGSGRVIEALVGALPSSAIRWSASAEKWSTLEDPALPWPPIDPPRWVTEREYSSRDPNEVLAEFSAERADALAWLDGFAGKATDPGQWDRPHEHPEMGPLSARDMLAAWVTHDLLHIRQLNRLQYEYLRATSGGPLEYAGEW